MLRLTTYCQYPGVSLLLPQTTFTSSGLRAVTKTLYRASVQAGLERTSLERRQVLDAILTSDTFRRSEQLKRLLTYLFDQDELGRIHQVTEYELGTRALGRAQDFSPETDSSVRTRMHGLRQKLEEYYRDEASADDLKIDIPKGSYRLQFQPKSEIVNEPPLQRRRNWLPYAAITAVVLVAAAWFVARPAPLTPLQTLWQPMLSASRSPVLLVGQPLHVWVRNINGQAEPLDYPHFPDPVPTSPNFLNYIRPRVPANAKTVFHSSPNATLWGDAAGAASAARFLAFRQTGSELLPESAVKSELALRGRPILAFGRPEYSPAIQRYLLTAGGYTIGMLNPIRQYSIYKPSNPDDRFLNKNAPNEVNHGLVTVLNDGGARVFVFSGITSDGSAAGLDYFTNETAIAQLWDRIQKQGYTQWPQAFQVVLKVSSSSGYAMEAQYEKHVVLQPE
jgi:hypothetical protein